MQKQIEEILKDLYALDGGLRQDEDRLRKIIADLISAKPDIRLDDDFIQNLKIKILDKAKSKAENKSPFRLFNRLPYALGGAAFVLLAVLFAGSYFEINSGKISLAPQNKQGDFKSEVTQLTDGAFGSLAALSVPEEQKSTSSAAFGALSLPASSGEGGGATGIAVMPEIMTAYKYVYRGDDFSVSEDKMPVYKRTDSPIAAPISEIISKFDFGGISLKKLSSARIENLTLAEDREFGYIVSINFKDGALYIYKNWEKWPQNPGYPCKGDVCIMDSQARPEIYPAPGLGLSLSDIPSDEEIISIADSFLKEYGIDVSGYGSGKVLDFGMRLYSAESGAAALFPYIPEEVSVVYPLLIDGKTVFDQSGNENGLIVGVDIRHKKVSNLSNLRISKYESSLYETETDTAKILEAAQGGMGYFYYYGEGEKAIEIPLGTPFLGIMATWKYDEQTNGGYELYVPALVFPVLKVPDGIYYYQRNVVVPIIKEVLNYNFFPKPEPLAKPLLK